MNVYYYPGSYIPVRTTTTGWTQVATSQSISVVYGSFASSAEIDITDVIIPAGKHI